MAEFIEYWSNADFASQNYVDRYKEDQKGISKKAEIRPRKKYTVRDTVCVAGNDLEAIWKVKAHVHRLLSGRETVESFHFRSADDVRDGAFFVPKVILVAVFQPGKKLISESEEDDGQLDFAYDEIFNAGADLMVVYLNLPDLIYPQMNSLCLYHPFLESLVFPGQPLVQNLATHDLLLTITDRKQKFNSEQDRRLLEWLLLPVDQDTHSVYRVCAEKNAALEKENFSEHKPETCNISDCEINQHAYDEYNFKSNKNKSHKKSFEKNFFIGNRTAFEDVPSYRLKSIGSYASPRSIKSLKFIHNEDDFEEIPLVQSPTAIDRKHKNREKRSFFEYILKKGEKNNDYENDDDYDGERVGMSCLGGMKKSADTNPLIKRKKHIKKSIDKNDNNINNKNNSEEISLRYKADENQIKIYGTY